MTARDGAASQMILWQADESERFDDPEDRWAPIPGFPGCEASDKGRIRSYWRRGHLDVTRAPKLVKQHPLPTGHVNVAIWKESERRYVSKSVHRLVLTAFAGPCPEGMQCCHGNGDGADNRLENLRWDTRSRNTIDSVLHGTHNVAKLQPEDIPAIWDRLRAGESCRSIAKDYPVNWYAIWTIKAGQTWVHITQNLDGFPLMTESEVEREPIRAPEEYRCLDKEIWKPLPGYPLFRISNLGRVQTCLRRATPGSGAKHGWIVGDEWFDRRLEDDPRGGYPAFAAWDAEKRKAKTLRVHQCVLLAFAGPAPEGMCACHDDDDKTNNTAANLRWDTPKENQRDRYRTKHAAPSGEGPGPRTVNKEFEIPPAIVLGDEEWRPFEGFPRYRISNYGNVQSCMRNTGKGKGWVPGDQWREITPYLGGTARRVGLSSDSHRQRLISVAYFVLYAFVGPPPHGLVVCYRDGDRMNCRLDNLYWGPRRLPPRRKSARLASVSTNPMEPSA